MLPKKKSVRAYYYWDLHFFFKFSPHLIVINYDKNEVHIDHVIPISWANTEKQVLALNHYSNLQLLSVEDNLLKKDSKPKFINLKRVFDNHPNKELLYNIVF